MFSVKSIPSQQKSNKHKTSKQILFWSFFIIMKQCRFTNRFLLFSIVFVVFVVLLFSPTRAAREKTVSTELLQISTFFVPQSPPSASLPQLSISYPSSTPTSSTVPHSPPPSFTATIVNTISSFSLQPSAQKSFLSTPLLGYPEHIIIPSINLSSPISQVGYTYIDDAKTWEVPNTVVGTPKEQIPNNLILIGHTGLFTSVFEAISQLQQGDIIFIENITSHRYTIATTTLVAVNDLTYVYPQDEPTLTLITCVHNEPNLRRIIVAKPA